jgi:hypothetical protein
MTDTCTCSIAERDDEEITKRKCLDCGKIIILTK